MQTNVERVKEKMDIVTVVGGYVTLQKAGALLRARCPFHNEKSPSFTVSPVRQTYHCFGCGEHGDIFTFVEKIEGLDFRGALELLAQKAGVELVNEKGRGGYEGGPSRDEKEALFAVTEAAAMHYEINVQSEKSVLDYLHARGLSDKTISTFRLGFAKDSWQACVDALRAAGHKDADIEKAGLTLKGDRGYYDRFRSRIMFPIANAQGKIAGFTGRIWIDETQERTPEQKEKDATAAKYVNSPETALYHKSSILYGFHIAKHHIRPLNCTLIVEGQMDLLTCHQVGYTNAVAISGTALTEEQVRQLSRLSTNMLLALDSDKAGIDATIKSIDKALMFGCDVKVVSFRGKDASEVLQKEGPEAVKECVREAVDWCAYLLSVIEVRSEGDSRKRARLVNDMLMPLIKVVDNPLERDTLLTTIHERTNLSLESLKESLAHAQKKTPAVATPTHSHNPTDTRVSQSGGVGAMATKRANNIHLLFASMDIAEVRAHPSYTKWLERLSHIERPELSDSDMHTLLATFPTIEHASHVDEIVEELFARAEREQYAGELEKVGEEIRSAELAGDEARVLELSMRARTLHMKMSGNTVSL